MIINSFRRIFLSLCLLTALSASAQEFDSELQLSTDEVIYWYRICNAAPGMDGYAMTDLNATAFDGEEHDDALKLAVYLLPTETEDYRSQWKLTAGEEGKVIITNRATGSQISNTSGQNANLNVTWLTFSSDAQGFTFTDLGDNAFKLEGIEDDGVNRCLAMIEKDSEAITYPESGESTSVIGWKFFPIEIDTEISSAKADRSVIRVNGKRISVSGCPEWQLFNAEGEEMPRTVALPTGIYMVKLTQKTVKVLVP